MIDEALFGIGADHYARDTQTVAVLIDFRRNNMIIETAPVIPGEKDGRAVPVWTLHHGIDQSCHIGLASTH